MAFPRLILFRVIRSAALAWLTLRIAGAAVGVGSFSVPVVGLISLSVLAVSWLDIRSCRERLLIANLGISPYWVSGIVLSVALVLDLSTALLVGLLRTTGSGG